MILKFQQGGNALPPFATYNPISVTNTNASLLPTVLGTDATKKGGSDLTDKDLLTMLEKLDGLPSDMQLLTKLLLNFYIDLQYSPNLNTSNISSRYLSILYQLKQANFNRKLYDSAFNIVNQNGGINEFAITQNGQLIGEDSLHNYKLLTLDELKESNGKYNILTNAEILQRRAYDERLANQSDLITVVQNGIGMSTINKLIEESLKNLGTTETTKEGFITKKASNILGGVEILKEALSKGLIDSKSITSSLDGMYKSKLISKNLAEQASQALNYIYKTLPKNAKTLLLIKSDGTDKGAKDLIISLISSQLNISENFDISAETFGKGKAGSSNRGGSDSTDLKTSLPLNIMKGIGGNDTKMTIDKGNGIGMEVLGNYYAQIKSPKGEPIINTSLEAMLAESGLLNIVSNTRNITFGDQKISPELLRNITYNNTGIIRAELPINEDGTVRLDILEDFLQALNDIKLLGNDPTKEQILKIYKKYNLDDLLLSDGTPNIDKFGVFMVTEGYTNGDNGITDSDYVTRRSSVDMSSSELDLIEESLTRGTGDNAIHPNLDRFSWYNPLDYFWGDDIYKAAIYIPINNNVNLAVYGADQNLDYDEAVNQEIKYLNFNKVSNLQSTSADLL